MATVSKRIAEEIILEDGWYADDPQVTRVVKYTNQWGGESYALVYGHQDQERYHKSPACKDVEVVWEVEQ